MFKNIASSKDMAQAEDRVGGFSVLPAGIYEATIKMAYGGKSKGGAGFMAVTLNVNGKDINEDIYVTSGDDKGNKSSYTDKKTKEEKPLPGFTLINDLALITSEGSQELRDLEWETKTVEVYDYQSRQKIPKELEVAVDLIGKRVLVALTHEKNFAQEKGANGEYVNKADGSFREKNAIAAFFDVDSQLTVREAQAGITEPKFHGEWLKAYEGKVTGNYKEGAGGTQAGRPQASKAAGTAAAGGAEGRPSLFKKQ